MRKFLLATLLTLTVTAGLPPSIFGAVIFCNTAEAKDDRELIQRPNTSGKMVTLRKARNFDECVANGMTLGHPRVGPSGDSDRRGAVGYCHSLGF